MSQLSYRPAVIVLNYVHSDVCQWFMAPKPTTAERVGSLHAEPEVAACQDDISGLSTAANQLVGLELSLVRTGLRTPKILRTLAKNLPALRACVNTFLAGELKAGHSQHCSINL